MRELIKNVGTDYFALAVTGIVILIVSIIYLWRNAKNRSMLSIPGLSSQDETLGNLGQITKSGGLHQFLADNHKKLGPMFSFFWGKELTVSIASPAIWKDIQTLFDRPVTQFEHFKPLLGEYCIQHMNTPIGQQHRKILDRHYSFTSISMYYDIFNKIGNELVTKWKNLPKHEMVPLRQHMMAIGIKSITRISFGKDQLKTNKEILEIERAYDVCWHEMEIRLNGDFPEPDSQRMQDYNKEMAFLKKKMIEVVNHKRATKVKSQMKDLLDIMLEDGNLYQNDQQIIDQVVAFFVGGFQTTGNLLTWMVYFLCKSPEVLSKMVDEIKDVLGDKEFTMEDMEELVFTKQVIDETMRCLPLAPWTGRYSEYDMVIEGHAIPKHTPIILALGCVLQNENIWPEPKKFDPNRFGPTAPKRHPLAFQPFGFAGKRKCPGYRFAYYEATIFIIAIVRNFKITLVPDQNVEIQYGLIAEPKEEIYVTVESR